MAHEVQEAGGLPDPPGIWEKAGNLARATAEHVVAGLPKLSAEESEVRLAICRSCEMFDRGACRLCGCNMAVKASWAEQRCPLAKWPA